MDIIQPSPTAANLAKYGDIPVTMYLGQANISLPIFNIDGGDINLPISLSYNYTGLRPNDQIGWVGMGWSLLAGGVITVNVRGIPDGSASAGKNYEQIVDSLTKATPVNQTILSETAKSATYDLEPDMYSFNFAGYSGKFIKFKGKFYCFPASKLKIEGTADNGFIITAENGNRYEFYAPELTRQKTVPEVPSFGSFVSSWYLTRITNAAQTEEIRLNYIQEGKLAQFGGFSQSYLKYEEIGNPAGDGPAPRDQLYPITADMATTVECLRLSSIISEKYKITFDPESTPREDISASPAPSNLLFYALKSIRIENRIGDLVKKIKLDHGYFGAGLSKYLNLLALKEYNVRSLGASTVVTDSLVHTFDYEDGPLPIKGHPTGIDHYGYYNGVISSNLIPEKVIQGGVTIPMMPGGANREPSFIPAKSCALKKIHYPTGGYSEFIYESNQIEAGNFLSTEQSMSLSVYRSIPDDFSEIDSLKPFHLDGDQKVNIWYARTGKAPISMDSVARENKKAEVFVYKLENGIQTLVYTIGPYRSAINSGQSVNVDLSAGDYIFRVHCDETEDKIDLQVTYNNQTNIPNLMDAHGIRVQKIINHPVSGSTIEKSYKYLHGKGLLPTYNNTSLAVYFPIIAAAGFYRWLKHTLMTSSIAEGQGMGTPYFYSTVIEETSSSSGTKLRSIYDYRNFDNEISYAGIKLVKKIDYKHLNNNFIPQSKVEYTYNTDVQTYFTAVKPPYKNTQGEPQYLTHYLYDGYQLMSGWDQIKSVIETSYDGDSIKVITDNTYNPITNNLLYTRKKLSNGTELIEKYKYASDYSLPAESSLAAANMDAKIETQVWKKTSLTDSVITSGTINQFDAQKFKPINIYALNTKSILRTLNNEPLNGQGKYTTLVSDSHYEKKVSYQYNSYGKLEKQHVAAAIPISYKWGYEAIDPVGTTSSNKRNHPIAECRNAEPDEFLVEDFEDNLVEQLGTAHTGLRCHVGNYTVNWTLPNQRSYLISYWYLSGYSWLFMEKPYVGPQMILTDGSAYDDIRIHPTDAQMTTYTYKTGAGITTLTDTKNLVNYYEYDGFNRLLNIKDDKGNIIKNFAYNYMNRAAVWTDTQSYCQVDQAGNNTGEQRMIQTDSNPLSVSYGTTRTISIGFTFVCPTPVYAKMIIESLTVDYSYGYNITVSKYRAHLFSNQDCTIPYVATNTMNINCKVFYTNEYDNGDPSSTQTQYSVLNIPAGGSLSNYIEVISGCSPPLEFRLALKSLSSSGTLKALNDNVTTNSNNKSQQFNKGDDPKPATTCTSFTISVEPGTGYIRVN
nr:hypothetical protein [Pedobacter sp. ASV2]